MLNSVNIILNRPPTSKRCHQHRCSLYFLRSIIYWKHYNLAVFRRFRPGYQYFGMFLSQNRGVTHCSSTVQLRSANQRKNQLTFEAFELIPISYIVQRDSFLTQLDIEMPQRNLYAASGILKYG